MNRNRLLTEVIVMLAVCFLAGFLLIPRMVEFRAKGHQAEALMNLQMISSLEKAYRMRHDGHYWGGYPAARPLTLMRDPCQVDNPLGFSVPDCTLSRYSYSVQLVDSDGSGVVAFAQEWSQGGRRVFEYCRNEAPRMLQVKTSAKYWVDKVIKGHDRWSLSPGGEPRHVTDGIQSCW